MKGSGGVGVYKYLHTAPFRHSRKLVYFATCLVPFKLVLCGGGTPSRANAKTKLFRLPRWLLGLKYSKLKRGGSGVSISSALLKMERYAILLFSSINGLASYETCDVSANNNQFSVYFRIPTSLLDIFFKRLTEPREQYLHPARFVNSSPLGCVFKVQSTLPGVEPTTNIGLATCVYQSVEYFAIILPTPLQREGNTKTNV